MLKQIILSLFATATMTAASNPPAPAHPPNGFPDRNTRYTPWGDFPIQWCAQQWSVGTPGAATQIGAMNVRVTMTITAVAQTGYHGHPGSGRPNPIFLSASPTDNIGRYVTAFNGCVTFKWRGPGYSGWYLVQIFPGQQGDCGSCVVRPQSWPNEGYNIYLGAVDWIDRNTKKPLQDMGRLSVVGEPMTQPAAAFPDVRHDNRGRSATFNTIRKFTTLAAQWKIRDPQYQPSSGKLLAITRASLPDGGIVDNEFASAGSYLFTQEWVTRHNETHPTGNEVDVFNPGNNFDVLITLARISGCLPGRLDQDGNQFPTTTLDVPYFWRSQPFIHFTCGSSPILTL